MDLDEWWMKLNIRYPCPFKLQYNCGALCTHILSILFISQNISNGILKISCLCNLIFLIFKTSNYVKVLMKGEVKSDWSLFYICL